MWIFKKWQAPYLSFLLILSCKNTEAISWAIVGKVAAGVISSGTSLSDSVLSDKSYSIRVNIEIENWTKWELKDPVVDLHGGVITLPPSTVFPLMKEAMVKFLFYYKNFQYYTNNFNFSPHEKQATKLLDHMVLFRGLSVLLIKGL